MLGAEGLGRASGLPSGAGPDDTSRKPLLLSRLNADRAGVVVSFCGAGDSCTSCSNIAVGGGAAETAKESTHWDRLGALPCKGGHISGEVRREIFHEDIKPASVAERAWYSRPHSHNIDTRTLGEVRRGRPTCNRTRAAAISGRASQTYFKTTRQQLPGVCVISAYRPPASAKHWRILVNIGQSSGPICPIWAKL